jgi:phosphoglycolate phosphatase-like HAD superfamily hydrolase
MSHTLERAWDAFDAYLFDIDGTLINCTDATHYFAFCHALKTLSGRDLTLEGVTAHGNVDNGILRDALQLANVPEEQWRGRLHQVHAGMADYVEARENEICAIVLPQVRELLAHLKAKGAKLGVATGNLERIGKLKLRRAGLLDFFDFGGWSDAHEQRSDVFRAAVERARAFCDDGASICVLGDTPADVRAAHDNHLPVIAVATGIYPFEQLEAEHPELCLHTFAELLSATQPAQEPPL